MKYITFSYDNTRSKGLGWTLIITSALSLLIGEYLIASVMFFLGIALDTRIKKESQE